MKLLTKRITTTSQLLYAICCPGPHPLPKYLPPPSLPQIIYLVPVFGTYPENVLKPWTDAEDFFYLLESPSV